MTAVAKATSETEAVLEEDSELERDTDGGSGETKEVDLSETEVVLKEDSAEERDTDRGLVHQRRLILLLLQRKQQSFSYRKFCRGKRKI